ncbi:molybdenum cofactor guanylyltransferase MobA [Roseibium sp. CAU 1637]|uniref:Molybdenum cofactor guanylyltransferase n=1 Tax=Roseibium limicola TaxID=2816037 RepID=A0A939J957_9HYPH|nr:molybdenum cofactor guanylyltransferase MobA [Roseibium limicola]MBO0345053.1 molybdenum cofactor guanylyltransferase MobA [Roseibium limicola]
MSSSPLSRPDPSVLACVLAGGQSRRMGGGDKTLLDMGGNSMLGLILERLKPQVTEVILNANGDPARFANFGLPVVADPIEGHQGPLAGILAGLMHARETAPSVSHVVSIAGDTPFFPRDLIARLSTHLPSAAPVIALACSRRRLHPVFGLWPVALADDLQAWLEAGKSGKVLAWVERHDSIEVDFDDDAETGLDPFFNANRPEDLDTARAVLSQVERNQAAGSDTPA